MRDPAVVIALMARRPKSVWHRNLHGSSVAGNRLELGLSECRSGICHRLDQSVCLGPAASLNVTKARPIQCNKNRHKSLFLLQRFRVQSSLAAPSQSPEKEPAPDRMRFCDRPMVLQAKQRHICARQTPRPSKPARTAERRRHYPPSGAGFARCRPAKGRHQPLRAMSATNCPAIS